MDLSKTPSAEPEWPQCLFLKIEHKVDQLKYRMLGSVHWELRNPTNCPQNEGFPHGILLLGVKTSYSLQGNKK